LLAADVYLLAKHAEATYAQYRRQRASGESVKMT